MGEKFGAFRLKQSTVEYLQTLKQAFELSYDRDFTNDDFILQMAASVEDGDVAVWEFFCRLQDLKKEAKKKRAEKK